ncbi:putative disease resistance protein At3g14460, partial [Arachis duranensis]|uniref:Disease resistance protein At3g14460 n=1 Tax=Arachis duranensis TaxID=130453 RepID=A0A6P5NAX2_ARADU
MGRALLSAFIHDLLDLIASPQNSPRMKPYSYEQQELVANLQILDALVDDAEWKTFFAEGGGGGGNARDVKDWLNELQHALYHLEDLLLRIVNPPKSLLSYGRRFFVSVVLRKTKNQHVDDMVKLKIHDTIKILEALVTRKDLLGLTAAGATSREKPLQQQGWWPPSPAVLHSYLDGTFPKQCFVGRDDEIKSVLGKLSSATEEDGKHVKVINIVGKDGAGKTALSGVIYDSDNVTQLFERKAWITVPPKATVNTVAKKILEELKAAFSLGDSFDELMEKLAAELAGRKFLLVLDDIMVEDDGLHKLIASFESAAARGSALILTSTPHDDNPELFMIPASHVVLLDSLSTKNMGSIFSAHASSRQMNRPKLQKVAAQAGYEIIRNLGNLPLAARMIGSLVQDKLSVNKWVEMSRLLDAGDDIDVNLHPIPLFLALCYLDLPAQIKWCFAYLSLFPKGYQFKQTEVVLLWMAQGFLNMNTSGDKSMEDIADEYFGYLVMRSLLQPCSSGSGVSFTMHNLVHDLATYAFGESFNHHLSYSEDIEDFPEQSIVENRRTLRTILPLSLSLEQALTKFDIKLLEFVVKQLNPRVFRVLSLSRHYVTDLPASIGRLKHLCYLNISYTAIKTLPDSICDLLNLQELITTGCSSLKSLPERISNLVNLRHLDVRHSGLQEMPLGMHKLTSLRTLTDFVVSADGPGLADLAELSNLKTLSISKLQNVACAKDPSDAKLFKKILDDLMLQWGNGNGNKWRAMEVLENLKPHKDLKKLTLEYYDGARFPIWLGDPSYRALQLVILRHCGDCNSLPTLGMLPFLKDLFIEGFTQVSSIGAEFSGEVKPSWKPFQSLESLQFRDMFQWRVWNILEGIEFPRLIKLYIIRCPKLVGYLPKQHVSLQKLEIIGCSNLVPPLPIVDVTCKVLVHESNEILMTSVARSSEGTLYSKDLHEIFLGSSSKFTITNPRCEIEEISLERSLETESLDSPSIPDSTMIQDLKEASTKMLSDQVKDDIPKGKVDILSTPHPDTLETMAPVKIENLSNQDSDDQRSSFEVLKVSTVSQLKSLPPTLHSLKIEGCESLEVLPDDLLAGLTALSEFYLISCSSLTSLPSLGSVITLYIRNCRRLENLSSLASRKQLAFLRHLSIGSSCDSLTTLTLDLFPELKILCIWDCPNLQSFCVTKEIKGYLSSLESLEIRDCPKLTSFPEGGLLAPNLASIFLSNCENIKELPKPMTTLTSLKTLFLHRCPKLECLPFGGLPSSLTLLSIVHCDKLVPQRSWRLHTLESLNRFELEGGCMGIESFPEENLLPCNINSLRISTMQSLKKLNQKGFQHLNALHTLEIHCCDMLRSFPDQGLPSS